MKKMKILRKIKNNLIFISGYAAVLAVTTVETCLPIAIAGLAYFAFLVWANKREPCGGNHKTQV